MTRRQRRAAARRATNGTGRAPHTARSMPVCRRWAGVIGAVGVLGLGGCNALLNDDQLPTDVTDPTVTETPYGALQVYRGTILQFRRTFGGFSVPLRGGISPRGASVVATGGELTDELRQPEVINVDPVVDRRDLGPEVANDGRIISTYNALQRVRGQASQAIGLLRDYVPEEPALAGHAYALQGYAEVFLAELFCSGIPLSTLDYKGNYTPQPGSSTAQVLAHAVTLFDTAFALATDSVEVLDLARLGKARALLNLAEYAEAAATVKAVADSYTYAMGFATIPDDVNARNFFVRNDSYAVANGEGLSGLDYVSSGDPRTAVQEDGRRPAKYAADGTSPIVVASGLEARLIEAEAALQGHDYTVWLAKLNYLRQTETFWATIVPNPGAPLAPLEDPGAGVSDPAAADAARVDLMFRERAFWLFLTGHRQGDLRRLVRQYGRTQDEVYPSGPYFMGGAYGGSVTLPVPAAEQATNPLFTGCASRGA